MANNTLTIEQIARLPNVLGVVRIDDRDGSAEHTGAEAEALGNVLACLTQLSSLVGSSFGLDGLEEVHLTGKSLGILCLPEGDTTLGLVLNSRARPSELAARLRDGMPIS